MILNVYVIMDIVANETSPLFEAKNNNVALRKFEDVTDKVKFKSEYKLYKVGTYDNENMVLDRQVAEEITYCIKKTEE